MEAQQIILNDLAAAASSPQQQQASSSSSSSSSCCPRVVVLDDMPDAIYSDGCSSCGGMDGESYESSSNCWNNNDDDASGIRLRRNKQSQESLLASTDDNNLPLATTAKDPVAVASPSLYTAAPALLASSSTLDSSSKHQRQGRQQVQRQSSFRHRLQQQRTSWLIPAEHPLKLVWDCLTLLFSLVSAYNTHISIRDRHYRNNWLLVLCDVWFVADILLNFLTQQRHSGRLLDTCQAVWAHYLTSWFIIDLLSLFPGERFWLAPMVDRQNRRNVWTKTFFRSRAVVKLTRLIRHHHVQWIQQCAKHSKHLFGFKLLQLKSVKLIVRYVPKYLMFYRNMRAVVAIRVLRQVHWLTRMWQRWQYLQQRGQTVERERIETGRHGDGDALDLDDNDDNSILFDDDDDEYRQDWEYILDADEYDDCDLGGRALYMHDGDDDDGNVGPI